MILHTIHIKLEKILYIFVIQVHSNKISNIFEIPNSTSLDESVQINQKILKELFSL